MYAMATPYDRYKTQGILTANPLELIVMLYDGCIKHLKIAAMSIEEENFPKANESFQRAEDIILELVNSLDFHYPIANDLLSIYEFLLTEIIQINLDKDAGRIEPLVDILSSLRQSWHEISKEGRGTVTLEE
ncbi:flagellar export chaperone FliS [Eubacteriales bacterium OttesenSCG-928-M02]|nr:flagellar export chaperone FliS [Eubacteriales bacterium OttesenSCG-928-M02]